MEVPQVLLRKTISILTTKSQSGVKGEYGDYMGGR